MDVDGLRALVRDVVGFPTPEVTFKDITPLLADADALAAAVDAVALGAPDGTTVVAGIEARGFILAAPVARALGVGFVPVRKQGKLPWRVRRTDYSLEYGNDALEVHVDAAGAGDRVLLVDDVLATGGTAAAAVELLGELGAEVVGLSVLVELAFLGGRTRLDPLNVASVLVY